MRYDRHLDSYTYQPGTKGPGLLKAGVIYHKTIKYVYGETNRKCLRQLCAKTHINHEKHM